ncbi:zinc ribbon domain-containing protein, partial [Candidatus Bathyarchaeota archaeon]|nr:zinc ribbon domain-containing protein [Candidatus Bathyarchaeota archaeon]
MPFCTNCGAKADPGERFCANCGSPLKQGAVPPPPPPPTYGQPQSLIPPPQVMHEPVLAYVSGVNTKGIMRRKSYILYATERRLILAELTAEALKRAA